MCKCGCNKCDIKKNKNKMNVNKLNSLIRETIENRLKMIDEAGDKAAIKAKISKLDRDIQEAKQLQSSISSISNLKNYVSAEIISDLMEEFKTNIENMEAKKKEYEVANSPKKDKKTTSKKEELDKNKQSLKPKK